MLPDEERAWFDGLLDRRVGLLPEAVAGLLEEVPLIVDDEPGVDLLRDLGLDPSVDDLCGLHDGIALTERSVEDGAVLPEQIMLFRGPIMRLAAELEGKSGLPSELELDEQIRVTLLHEIGHHFGLDEDDLERLGYA